ncbi:hypothetical protein L596_014946 [Steinernema carpocapsae]|uniref:Uncharacterized protein n=1 Tax=Steinernema carpocapsae TaxID=34508 RepID=A0A4U5NEQ4_STECR|nr:hypothetical protein L596_014946 [Steinernema carpocapsae]
MPISRVTDKAALRTSFSHSIPPQTFVTACVLGKQPKRRLKHQILSTKAPGEEFVLRQSDLSSQIRRKFLCAGNSAEALRPLGNEISRKTPIDNQEIYKQKRRFPVSRKREATTVPLPHPMCLLPDLAEETCYYASCSLFDSSQNNMNTFVFLIFFTRLQD